MNQPDPPVDHAVERLIADHLDRRAQQCDATELLARVRRSRQVDRAIFSSAPQSGSHRGSQTGSGELPDGETTGRAAAGGRLSDRRRWAGALTWPVLAGVVLLAIFLAGRPISPSAANASIVLRDLQTVHLGETDRCYRIQYAPDPRYWDGSNQLEGPSHSVLWTRGDRFWSDCTIADIRLRIGRQQDGTLWVSRSRQHGIRFTADEAQLPQEVALLCAANSMTVPRLVEDVLADFDLRADRPATGSGAGAVVWAALKPGRSHPLISSALLEIDPENHALTRLVLWMVRDGRPRGTVSYTFLENGLQGDARYHLQAHLDDDAEVEDHTFTNPGNE